MGILGGNRFLAKTRLDIRVYSTALTANSDAHRPCTKVNFISAGFSKDCTMMTRWHLPAGIGNEAGIIVLLPNKKHKPVI